MTLSRYQFNHGTHFLLNNLEYVVKRIAQDEVIVGNISYDKVETWKQTELLDYWNQGVLQFKKKDDLFSNEHHLDFNGLPEDLKKIARWRYSVLEPVINETIKPSEISDYISQLQYDDTEKKKICKATFYNWKKRWEKYKDIRYLIPNFKERGPNKRTTNDEIIEIIETIMNNSIYSGEGYTVRSLYIDFKTDIKEANRLRDDKNQLYLISLTTFWRIVNEKRDSYKQDKARHGTVAAQLKHKGTKSKPRPELPLEQVEIDWTQIDVLVVNPFTLKSQNPWIVYAIDGCTRKPLGFYITFESPDSYAIKQCILHMILPKTYLKSLYPLVQKEWSCYGYPQEIVVDNHRVNESYDIEDTCKTLGISLQFCRVAAGHEKGAVERAFRTLNQKIFHNIPGTTFSNYMKRSEYDSEGKACITLQTLYYIAHIAIVDMVANTWHYGIRDVPENLWTSLVNKHPHLSLSLPHSKKELIITLGAGLDYREITNKGIQLKGFHFNSYDLMQIKNKMEKHKHNKEVKVRFDATNLNTIYVYNPYDEHFIEAYPDMQVLAQHGFDEKLPLPFFQMAVRSLQDKQRAAAFDDTHLGKAKSNIKALIQNDISDKKKDYSKTKQIIQEDVNKYEGVSLLQIAQNQDIMPEAVDTINSIQEINPKQIKDSKKSSKKSKKNILQTNSDTSSELTFSNYTEHLNVDEYDELPLWTISKGRDDII